MISVLSHRRLSNGSNILLVFFLSIFVFSSCKNMRKTEKYVETPSAEIEKPKSAPENVDTVTWNNKPADYPPIADRPQKPPRPGERPATPDIVTPDKPERPDTPDRPGKPTPNQPIESLQGSYNVAIMAPFNTHKETYGQVRSKTSIKSIEFYAGVKMALERLGMEGLNLNVYTYDTQGSAGVTSSLFNRPEMYNMNLILGPMKTDALKMAASKVRGKQNTFLVSPWNPKTSITSANPNYIQVSPSLSSHCRAIMRHVLKNYSASKVVLACREGGTENKNFKYFQDEQRVIRRNASAPKLPELIAQYGDDIPLQDYYRSDTTVFIVPSWDEKFVSNLLRKIYSENGGSHVVVYGMPQWKDFERIGYEYYERLNVRISNSNFMDKDNPEIQNFRRDYYNMMGAVPGKDAILGYDLMMYFGRMLKKRGATFAQFLNRDYGGNHLHTQFNFNGIFKSGTENFSKAERFENQYLNILHYKDFKFQKLN